MDNPEKLATQGTQDQVKQSKKATQLHVHFLTYLNKRVVTIRLNCRLYNNILSHFRKMYSHFVSTVNHTITFSLTFQQHLHMEYISLI